jgi:hypothetical protein
MEAHHEINGRKTVVKRAIVMTISVLLALIVALPMAVGQVGKGADASGTAEELAAAWWQWALSKPTADSPLIGSYEGGAQCDGTPVTPTQGKQWFLAGTFGGGSAVERTCTMPVGTHLFFPVVNVVAFPFAPGETEENQRQIVIDYMNNVLSDPEFSMLVTVDGKEVKSNRLVRALSPVFTVTLPDGNVFGIPKGDYESASANGLWVALPPLPPGEHIIHFEMSAPNADGDPVTPGIQPVSPQDITYNLTVVNSRLAP